MAADSERDTKYPDAFEEFKEMKLEELPERKRRKQLPRPRHDIHLSLWKTLKSFVGKDLTRVTIPVNFNEPLTFLQRITEDLEFSEMLDLAAQDDMPSSKRLMYLAVFSALPFASVAKRYSKPFNPLLAETYELVREDKGYISIAEQVSHHPPITCLHAESKNWTFWQEFKMDSKFRGIYFKIIPTGSVHFKIRSTDEHYTWTKPCTTIHNLILGSLWNDQEGIVRIVNHQTGESACMFFEPYKVTKYYTSIKGEVYDRDSNVTILIKGDWQSFYKYKHVDDTDWTHLWSLDNDILEENRKFYGFSPYAINLNEAVEGIAPTDSRFRPDQRALEYADVDLAAIEKHRLEEEQRLRRKQENNAKPLWFEAYEDPDTKSSYHAYKGGYWKAKLARNWDDCSKLF